MRRAVGLVSLKDGGWYCTVFGAGSLGSKSSGWHDVLAVGCAPVASGGVDPASPVYPKACLIAANWSMSSLVAHACLALASWTSAGNCCHTQHKIVLTSHPSRTFMCSASSLEQVAPGDMRCCHFPGNLHEKPCYQSGVCVCYCRLA